ncbi:hypothetical protein ACIOJD_29770 [Streptomyces sp. NPDC088116]|uniref:hypothetical protein n=1 Tax=Streptomyces sp. NPDC088116 TaxID=3365825 RepID=UPI0038103006
MPPGLRAPAGGVVVGKPDDAVVREPAGEVAGRGGVATVGGGVAAVRGGVAAVRGAGPALFNRSVTGGACAERCAGREAALVRGSPVGRGVPERGGVADRGGVAEDGPAERRGVVAEPLVPNHSALVGAGARGSRSSGSGTPAERRTPDGAVVDDGPYGEA